MTVKFSIIGLILFSWLFVCWGFGLWAVARDIHQGEVYRIIYVHVPVCLTAFVCAIYLFAFSIHGLARRTTQSLVWGHAVAELGLLYTVLGLATGSIWGRVTWGVWWTWDARLLTTFILGLLFAAYLLLQQTLPRSLNKVKACAVLGILIFIDIPIIYKSVTWWRTLHQPPSLATGTLSPEIRNLLVMTIIASIACMTWLFLARSNNIKLQHQIDDLAGRIN